eukprot:15481996-Alexandrium_andersonii.AAC.1
MSGAWLQRRCAPRGYPCDPSARKAAKGPTTCNGPGSAGATGCCATRPEPQAKRSRAGKPAQGFSPRLPRQAPATRWRPVGARQLHLRKTREHQTQTPD